MLTKIKLLASFFLFFFFISCNKKPPNDLMEIIFQQPSEYINLTQKYMHVDNQNTFPNDTIQYPIDIKQSDLDTLEALFFKLKLDTLKANHSVNFCHQKKPDLKIIFNGDYYILKIKLKNKRMYFTVTCFYPYEQNAFKEYAYSIEEYNAMRQMEIFLNAVFDIFARPEIKKQIEEARKNKVYFSVD